VAPPHRFEVVSNAASKENAMLLALESMMADWEETRLSTTPYRETGVKILTSVEGVQLLLEDHITKTQTMKGSPFVKPHEGTAGIQWWQIPVFSL